MFKPLLSPPMIYRFVFSGQTNESIPDGNEFRKLSRGYSTKSEVLKALQQLKPCMDRIGPAPADKGSS